MVNIPLDLKLGEMKKDLERYRYGALAGRLLQSKEGSRYIGGAFNQLASDMGIEESAEGFIQGTMESEKGLQIAAMTYAKKYEEAMGKLRVQDLYGLYSGSIEKYLGKDELESFSKKYGADERNVGDLSKKVANIQHNMNHPTDEKIRAKAEKEMEKYEDFAQFINFTQEEQYKNLLPKAIENLNKLFLQSIAKVA